MWIELNFFFDASAQTYKAVAYFVFSNKDYKQNIYSFVLTKLRLSPLKEQSSITIPKLELQAVVFAVRLKCTILEEIDFDIDKYVTVDDILKEIKQLDITKATQKSNTPTKILKQFPNLTVDILHKNINSCLTESTFPNDFKKALVHPVHKKEWETKKSKYRPISILPNPTKKYERLLYDSFDNFFVKHQCGFRKGYNV